MEFSVARVEFYRAVNATRRRIQRHIVNPHAIPYIQTLHTTRDDRRLLDKDYHQARVARTIDACIARPGRIFFLDTLSLSLGREVLLRMRSVNRRGNV